jgi:hypothetical protein
MAQIIPRSNWLGESLEKSLGPLGTGMAQGMSTGLQALANMKLQQIQQRQQAAITEQGLSQFLPPEEARMVSLMPPQLASIYYRDKLARSRDQDLYSLLSSEANNQPIDQIAQSEMRPPTGMQTPTMPNYGFWNLFPQQQVNQAVQNKVQAPEVTPEKLRSLADRIEILDPKRFAARVKDLRSRARAIEAEQIQARGEKRRKSLKTKKLSDAVRMQFLIDAGGDIEKAKRMATEAGYED